MNTNVQDIVAAVLMVLSYFFGHKNGKKAAYRQAAGLERR